MYATLQVSGKIANVKTIPLRTDDTTGQVTPEHKVFQFLTFDDKKGLQTLDIKDKENTIKDYAVDKPITLPVRITSFKGSLYYSVV